MLNVNNITLDFNQIYVVTQPFDEIKVQNGNSEVWRA